MSTLCSTNFVNLKFGFEKHACAHCSRSSDTLSATRSISCSKQSSVTVRDFSGRDTTCTLQGYTSVVIYFVSFTLTEILQYIVNVI